MNKKILSSLFVMLSGVVVTACCLTIGVYTDGDYRLLFLANMITFAAAGSILRKHISNISVVVGVILLSIPYGFYYSTQIGVTPRIVLFPVLNILAILFGYSYNKILVSIKVQWKIVAYLCSCVLISLFSMSAVSGWVSSNETSRRAPSFEVSSLDGEMIKSDDLKGKILIVDFWATWCAPCIAEFKALEKFQNEIGRREDVVLLVVNEDNGGDVELAKKFNAKRKFNLPFFADESGSIYKAFNANAYPALYIIDRDSNIRLTKSGYNPSEDLLKTLLDKIQEIDK